MSRLQMFRISRQELYKPCNVYKDQNERDMGSIMWVSGYWRPPLYAVWLGGPGVPQSPFSQAQEGPPGTRGLCLFTQLGPQAVCGTRPNRLYSYCLRPTQTHTHPHARHDFVYFSNRQWQRSYFTTVFGNNYFTFTLFQAELLKQFMPLWPQTLTSSFPRQNMSNLSYMTIQLPETSLSK